MRVAAKHYLQVTDAHFEEATVRGPQEAAHKAAHNTTQLVGTDRNALEEICENIEKCADSRMPLVFEMGDEGLEPPTFAV